MFPSTEVGAAESQFAGEVLRSLLRHIEAENRSGNNPFLVSHAWTQGPMMYLVYTAPPSDRTWGLVRDTRESIIDPSPWHDVKEAVLYYYLCDLQENQPSAFFRRPGEPDTIRWFGHRIAGLPERRSDIPEFYRYNQPEHTLSFDDQREQPPPVVNEPRQYADPL